MHWVMQIGKEGMVSSLGTTKTEVTEEGTAHGGQAARRGGLLVTSGRVSWWTKWGRASG